MTIPRLIIALIWAQTCVASTPTPSTIDAVLDAALETGRIPGVIAMAANADETFYRGAFGMQDRERKSLMSLDTIVQLASMTKAVTSVAVMQLVEQGKVGLDLPVEKYLPRLADVQVLTGFSADSKPILRAPKSPVTVRHLLSHTSGYVYEVWNKNAQRNVEFGDAASIFTGGDGFLDSPLAFDPGTDWEYGISTDILGVLVSVISGQSLDNYFHENILIPLGMLDTYFVLPDEKLPRLATAYAKSKSGELAAIPYSRPDDAFLSGGGGLSSTAGDYIRFLRALLNDGELDGARILSTESVDLMAQNHIGDLEAGSARISVMPELSNVFDFMPDSVDKFGLGFLLNTNPVPGGRSAGSLAWAGLYNTYFWVDRDQGICGVLLTQILPFYDADVVHLLGEFEKAVYGSLAVTEN